MIGVFPTASTAQILGNNECFEPFTSNIYVRRVLSGEFVTVNRYLVKALEERDMWNEQMRDLIIASDGSVQNIEGFPEDLKPIFKTVWEMKMRSLVDLAADRAIFIDQSQSLNLWMQDPTHKKLSSMHFYGWKKGLKTGIYYLRTRPSVEAVKTTIDVETREKAKKGVSCDDEVCVACSA